MTLAKETKGAEEAGPSDGNEADDEEDEEAKLMRQMEELNARMVAEKRTKKKSAQKLVRQLGVPSPQAGTQPAGCCNGVAAAGAGVTELRSLRSWHAEWTGWRMGPDSGLGLTPPRG